MHAGVFWSSRRRRVNRSDLHALVLRAGPHRLDLANATGAAAGLRRHELRRRRRWGRKRWLLLLRRRRLEVRWPLAGRGRWRRQAEDGVALDGDEGHDGELVAGADLDHEAVGVVEEELVHVDAALLHAPLHVPDAQLLEPPLHRLHALTLHPYVHINFQSEFDLICSCIFKKKKSS